MPDARFLKLRTVSLEPVPLIKRNGVQLCMHHDLVCQRQIFQDRSHKSRSNAFSPVSFFNRKTLELDNAFVLEPPASSTARNSIAIGYEMRALFIVVIILL